MKYQEEFKFNKNDYMVLCGEKNMTDIDKYLINRYKSIKNKAELELETIEMYGEINQASKIAKADAKIRINLTNYLLKVKEKTR